MSQMQYGARRYQHRSSSFAASYVNLYDVGARIAMSTKASRGWRIPKKSCSITGRHSGRQSIYVIVRACDIGQERTRKTDGCPDDVETVLRPVQLERSLGSGFQRSTWDSRVIAGD